MCGLEGRVETLLIAKRLNTGAGRNLVASNIVFTLSVSGYQRCDAQMPSLFREKVKLGAMTTVLPYFTASCSFMYKALH